MAELIGELKRDVEVPFGCNVISDPMAGVALLRGHWGEIYPRRLYGGVRDQHGGVRHRGR